MIPGIFDTPFSGLIVDLFGGPGGWDEALRMLGVDRPVIGIEHDAAACATRAAAGHLTIRADVAAYPVEPFLGRVWGLIASPPCPPFSAAGKRGGARDEAQLRAHLLACAGHGWIPPEPPEGGWTDPRSPLVLQPLRWAEALRPEWIILEQVPLVARLWSAMAVALEALGYRTKVALVQAADYGVPQTRQRAVLIACLSSWPTIPRPTHAKEASSSRQRWVSMAAALGWDPSLVGFARRDDRGDSPTGYRERDLRDTEQPAFTVTEKARSWQRELVRIPTGQTGARSKETRRGSDEPAPTVAFGHNASPWAWEEGVRVEVRRGPRPGDEPGDNLAEGFDPAEEPAQTVTSRVDRWQINTGRDWKPGGSREDAQTIDVTDSPAPAFTGKAGGQWWIERPATTLQGDPRVFVPGGHIAHDGRDNSKMKGRSEDAVRISIPEALMLQSFPADYPVQGVKTKQFEQIGNAVPPLLAAHLLAPLVGMPPP